MEDIKRYEQIADYDCEGDEILNIMRRMDDGGYVQYTDHKAVVEIKDKRYETQLELYKNLTYENDDLRCERNNLTEKVKTMQNKIEELEKERDSLKCYGDGDGCKGNQIAKGIK